MPTSTLHVSSPSFANGTSIPVRYTADGEDISPPLAWSGVPAETKSVVVLVDDPDAPGSMDPFAHWLVYGLPPDLDGLPEGASGHAAAHLPGGALEGTNSFRLVGYRGPAPPPGRPHRYRFTVAALDAWVELKPGATRRELLAALDGHVLAQGEVVGLYGR